MVYRRVVVAKKGIVQDVIASTESERIPVSGQAIQLPVAQETAPKHTKDADDRFRYRRADVVSGGEYANNLMTKFYEYVGEVYYPCAGYDVTVLSVDKLIPQCQ